MKYATEYPLLRPRPSVRASYAFAYGMLGFLLGVLVGMCQ